MEDNPERKGVEGSEGLMLGVSLEDDGAGLWVADAGVEGTDWGGARHDGNVHESMTCIIATAYGCAIRSM